jgi:hypothetical protein
MSGEVDDKATRTLRTELAAARGSITWTFDGGAAWVGLSGPVPSAPWSRR